MVLLENKKRVNRNRLFSDQSRNQKVLSKIKRDFKIKKNFNLQNQYIKLKEVASFNKKRPSKDSRTSILSFKSNRSRKVNLNDKFVSANSNGQKLRVIRERIKTNKVPTMQRYSNIRTQAISPTAKVKSKRSIIEQFRGFSKNTSNLPKIRSLSPKNNNQSKKLSIRYRFCQ